MTAVYFASFLLYTGIVLGYLGADGWNLPVQANWTAWKCFYNITNWQKYLFIAIGGYVGCLFISFLTMLISAKTRSTVLAVMTPVVLIFIPSFISNIDSPVVNKIIGLLPDQLLQIQMALGYFNLYSVGGMVAGEVPVILVLYTVLTVVIVPVVYHVYRRLQA